MEYCNTQRGVLSYVLGILAIIGLVAVAANNERFGSKLETYTLGLLFSVIFLLFYQLKIRVNSERIRVSFGVGIIAFNVRPDSIISTETIKTKIWWGIGIRLTPYGWLYNISTGPAVLIKYDKKGSSKELFVGTNKPDQLQKAIQSNFPS